MPPPQAAIGRSDAAVAATAQPGDADPQAGDRQEAADQRGPDDDLAPQRAILSQDRGIEPVRHRAEPAPEALEAGGQLHHLPAPARDIGLRPGRIGIIDAVERRITAEGLDRPLVHLRLRDPLWRARNGAVAAEFARDPVDILRIDLLDRFPRRPVMGAGGDPHLRDGPRRIERRGHPQHRPPRHHLDPGGGQHHGVGQHPCLPGRQLEGREPPKLRGRCQARIVDIEHHEAGQAPQRHDGADEDAQPAMQQQDRPQHGQKLRP